MKKNSLILLCLFSLVAIIISCNQEEIFDAQPEKNTLEEGEQFRIVAPLPYGVDLTIDQYYTDIPSQTDICTPDSLLLPNTHCNGGVRQFNAFVDILNAGTAPLAAGTVVEVQWDEDLWNTSVITQITLTSSLLPGGIVTASRPYYVGPCDCVQIPNPGNCFIHRFWAFVDPQNQISELNENNNASEIYETCSGCGPCPAPVSDVGAL